MNWLNPLNYYAVSLLVIYYISRRWYTDCESAKFGFTLFWRFVVTERWDWSFISYPKRHYKIVPKGFVGVRKTISYVMQHTCILVHEGCYETAQKGMGGRLSAEVFRIWVRRSEERNMSEQRQEEKTGVEEQRGSVPHGLVIGTLHCCCCCTGDKFLHSRGPIITSTHFCPVSRSP